MSADGAFNFGAYFSEVLTQEGDGFDIVIGNPPYVRQERIKDQKPQLKKVYPNIYTGRADLYVYFYARGLDLLNPHGTLAFITSNKFMRAGYGKKLRTILTKQTTLHSVIDFGDLPVFDATAYPTIVIVQRDAPNEENILAALTVDSLGILEQLPQKIDGLAWQMPQSALTPMGWSLVKPEVLLLMNKLRGTGQALSQVVDNKFFMGVKTGLNKAFVITKDIRDALIEEDPVCKEVIKPWLRGRDIQKWVTNWQNLYIIFTYHGIDIDRYQPIKQYLENYRAELEQRATSHQHKWYELQQPQTGIYHHFTEPKILYPHFNLTPKFSFEPKNAFANDRTYIIPNGSHALLGILNSNVTWFFLSNICPKVQQDYMEFRQIYIGQIPVPEKLQTEKLEAIVQTILNAQEHCEQVVTWERDLNALVYDLYGLTNDDIALIENSIDTAEKKDRIDSATKAIDKLRGQK